MRAEELMLLLLVFTLICLFLGVAGWAIEKAERRKRRMALPKPQPRAVAGEKYKAWM